MPDENGLVHRWAVIVLDRHARIDLDIAHVLSTKDGRRAWIRWSPSRRPIDSTDFQVLNWEVNCQRAAGRVLSTEAYDRASGAWHVKPDSTAPELPLLLASPWFEAGSVICRF
jgi:hypothetical protein